MNSKQVSKWKELYELAKEFKAMKPWTNFGNDEIVVIQPEGCETGYISIMGDGGMEYGFSLFIGERGYDELRRMFHAASDPRVPQELVAANNHCINMYIDKKSALNLKQLQTINELGLSFKGNNWIYFEKYEAGYLPSQICNEDVDLLRKYLRILIDILKGGPYNKIKYSVINTISLHRFNLVQGQWTCRAEVYSNEQYKYPKLIMEDDEEYKALNAKRITQQIWEMDWYVALDMVDMSDDGREVLPKVFLIVNRKDGMILDHCIYAGDETDGKGLEMLCQAIRENGRPKKIVCPNPMLFSLLEDFCRRANIPLEIGKIAACEKAKDDMESMNPKMIDMLGEIIDAMGVSLEELVKSASSMSKKEFGDKYAGNMVKALADVLVGDEKGFFDDYLLDDDYSDVFSDEWDFAYDDPRVVEKRFSSVNKGIKGIDEFFAIAADEDDCEIVYSPIDEGKTWQSLLLKNTKADLTAMCKKLEIAYSKDADKVALVSCIADEFYKKPFLMNLFVSDISFKLLNEIYRGSDDVDLEIVSVEEWKYGKDALAELLKMGLIDIYISYEDGYITLGISPVEGWRREFENKKKKR